MPIPMLISALFAAAGAASAPTPVGSVTQARHDGVTEIVISEVIGTVRIETGGDAVQIGVYTPTGAKALVTRRNGNQLRIAGPDGLVAGVYEAPGRWRRGNWGSGQPEEFAKMLEAYPEITLNVPAGIDVTVTNAALQLDARAGLSDVKLSAIREIAGTVGTVDSIALELDGSGRLQVGDAKVATVNVDGSADVLLGALGRLVIGIDGSGDVSFGGVREGVEIDIDGSGAVRGGPIGGAGQLSIDGSGEIELARVAGGLDIDLDGSGDIAVKGLGGALSIELDGSGDVDIQDADLSALDIQASGSGDVRVGGTAANPVVHVDGSTDVFVERATGTVRVTGRGDVEIGGRRYGEDEH